MPELGLVLSCEHGGNTVPARWSHLFTSKRARALLRSHRGWDRGALELGRMLSRALGVPLIACTTTRLLADANRPPRHPRLFSRFTRGLLPAERQKILASAHQPYWRAAEQAVRRAIARHGRALHLSVHSFTPVLGGIARRCDLGLLYDPRRPRERALCGRWRAALAASHPSLRVRRNHPYRGDAAALTTSLRRRFPPGAYLGIELELNQGLWSRRGPRARRELAHALAASIQSALES